MTATRKASAAAPPSRAGRSLDHAAQGELALPNAFRRIPVPARGSVFVLNFEDAVSCGLAPANIGGSMDWENVLRRWLAGYGDPAEYPPGVERAADGSVLSVTARDVALGCPLPGATISARSTETVIGLAMSRLGWRKVRATRGRPRQWRFHAPMGAARGG